jgi:hypothetical protein
MTFQKRGGRQKKWKSKKMGTSIEDHELLIKQLITLFLVKDARF